MATRPSERTEHTYVFYNDTAANSAQITIMAVGEQLQGFSGDDVPPVSKMEGAIFLAETPQDKSELEGALAAIHRLDGNLKEAYDLAASASRNQPTRFGTGEILRSLGEAGHDHLFQDLLISIASRDTSAKGILKRMGYELPEPERDLTTIYSFPTEPGYAYLQAATALAFMSTRPIEVDLWLSVATLRPIENPDAFSAYLTSDAVRDHLVMLPFNGEERKNTLKNLERIVTQNVDGLTYPHVTADLRADLYCKWGRYSEAMVEYLTVAREKSRILSGNDDEISETILNAIDMAFNAGDHVAIGEVLREFGDGRFIPEEQFQVAQAYRTETTALLSGRGPGVERFLNNVYMRILFSDSAYSQTQARKGLMRQTARLGETEHTLELFGDLAEHFIENNPAASNTYQGLVERARKGDSLQAVMRILANPGHVDKILDHFPITDGLNYLEDVADASKLSRNRHS
ncbi:MAG: hypothetical protein ABIA93_00095 [Candidatus Woesearchaeota archaeon]